MEKQVYYIIALNDDHAPVHTTRVCSDLAGAIELRDKMAKRYYEVVVCGEVKNK